MCAFDIRDVVILCFTKTAEGAFSSPHTLCIMGKTIHISICSKPDEAAWLLREQESILLTDDIMLWLPHPFSHMKTMLWIDDSNIRKILHFLTQQTLIELLPEEGTCCQRYLCANIFMALMAVFCSGGEGG